MTDLDLDQLDNTLGQLEDIYQKLKFSRDNAIKADKVDTTTAEVINTSEVKTEGETIVFGNELTEIDGSNENNFALNLDFISALAKYDNKHHSENARNSSTTSMGHEVAQAKDIQIEATTSSHDSMIETFLNRNENELIITETTHLYIASNNDDLTASHTVDDYDEVASCETASNPVSHRQININTTEEFPDYDEIPDEFPTETDTLIAQETNATLIRPQSPPPSPYPNQDDNRFNPKSAETGSCSKRSTRTSVSSHGEAQISITTIVNEWDDGSEDESISSIKEISANNNQHTEVRITPALSTVSIIDATQSEYMKNKMERKQDNKGRMCYIAMCATILVLIGLYIAMFISIIYVGTINDQRIADQYKKQNQGN